ncbi:hypothetical protein [Bacillus sp. AG4(2022)]|uniref:hypothetical protein n=1 Tax=Bacillus sp. AG4(2022) TaxID=2962594 RepID=UPI00288231C0|nr:hypothetical protein [Bacillus sp. AG4(2022)]MDT0160318.1 hypothetical protein [Bacillus sp. AG4(2022)]
MNFGKVLNGAFKGWYGKLMKYSTNKEKVKVALYHMNEEVPTAIIWLNTDEFELEF